MREGRPSFTAAIVAAARGLAGIDPLAVSLVEGPLGLLLSAGRGSRLRTEAINVVLLGLVDHLELRTLAIDEAVREGVRAGLTQLVLLGAGLDARAFRMPELREASVFEVDHPSTQAYKRARLGERRALAHDVRFVEVDFEKDTIADALARAGHDASRPTLWLWEGVTPYLHPTAMRSTLAGVSSRSAPGSRLLVTYATPEGTPLGAGFLRTASVVFRMLGESLRGTYSPDEMARELASGGFRRLEDTSSADWSGRFGAGKRRVLLVAERLAVAERTGA